MSDYKVKTIVVKDDGENGCFWRNGELYVRQDEREILMSTLAPHLTSNLMMEIELDPQRKPAMAEARLKSLTANVKLRGAL